MRSLNWPVVLVEDDAYLLTRVLISLALTKWTPPPDEVTIHRRFRSPKTAKKYRNNNAPINKLYHDLPISIPVAKLYTRNDFILGKRLGTGAFGSVYAGTMLSPGKPVVAIKVFHNTSQLSKSLIRDLLCEINTLAKLKHPGLVEFIGASLDPECFCLITELCSKGSLFALLHSQNSKKKLTKLERLRIADQICAGVEYLHNQQPKLIHRDLKSLNVVVNIIHTPTVKFVFRSIKMTMQRFAISALATRSAIKPIFL